MLSNASPESEGVQRVGEALPVELLLLPALELVHKLHLVVEDNVEGVVRGILAPLTRVSEIRRASGTKIICAYVLNGEYILPSAFRRIRFNLFLRNF